MKARTGFQLYEVEQGSELSKEVNERWQARTPQEVAEQEAEDEQTNRERAAKGKTAKKIRSGPNIKFRQQVVRELFAALSDETRAEYALRAKEETRVKREAYDEAISKPVEHTAEQRAT